MTTESDASVQEVVDRGHCEWAWAAIGEHRCWWKVDPSSPLQLLRVWWGGFFITSLSVTQPTLSFPSMPQGSWLTPLARRGAWPCRTPVRWVSRSSKNVGTPSYPGVTEQGNYLPSLKNVAYCLWHHFLCSQYWATFRPTDITFTNMSIKSNIFVLITFFIHELTITGYE